MKSYRKNRTMEMIPKKDLIDGKTYLGFSRNNHIAVWNAKGDKFYMTAWQFAPGIEEISHFEDVKETRQDGFVPLEIIENPLVQHVVEIKELQKIIGY